MNLDIWNAGKGANTFLLLVYNVIIAQGYRSPVSLFRKLISLYVDIINIFYFRSNQNIIENRAIEYLVFGVVRTCM